MNEQMLEDIAIGGNPIGSGICCIVLAIVLVVSEFVVYQEISIYTILMAAMIIVMGIIMIYSWINQINKIKDHIKSYQGKRVSISKLCLELHVTAAYFFKILGELKKKKDLKFELDDRTGELIVKAPKSVVKLKLDEETLLKDDKKAESKNIKFSKCQKCGREVSDKYEFCPSCGEKLIKISDT
ncbi:MAG: zinc-ribbon domain-containing protein [Candidatus Helarchaeota archaeon]